VKLINFFLNYSRRNVILALVAGFVSGICNIGILALITASFRKEGQSLRGLMWAFAAMCIVLPVSRFISEVLLNALGQDALFKLRLRLSRQILAAPLQHLEELGSHRLLATLTEDVLTITNTLLLIPLMCINAIVVIGCIAYLGWLSWKILLIVLAVISVGIVAYQMCINQAARALRTAREQGDYLIKNFQELTGGIKELKLNMHRRESFLEKVLQATANSMRLHNIGGMKIYSAAASGGQTLLFISIGLVLFAFPHTDVAGRATLIGYALALLYMITPLQMIMNTLPVIGRANIALDALEKLGLSLEARTPEAALRTMPSVPLWKNLRLVEVKHSYKSDVDDSSFSIGPFNLEFASGEMVFLVGGNGSGKTSFAKVLSGLYMPGSGVIKLDNTAISLENQDLYRQQFAVVFSDFHLFESLLGLEVPDLDARAADYLVRLHLDQKVKVKDGALSTTNLSQGQRKRLALLNAYLEDRPVYIFDEWAADQDPFFKDVFYTQILPEMRQRGKTIFVISHDDRYYHIADRIIKLEYGKIISDTVNTSSVSSSAAS
jgi:putative pyoverdin transport system ATP-binding/permease protein